MSTGNYQSSLRKAMLESLEWGLEHYPRSLFRRVFENEPPEDRGSSAYMNDFSALLSRRNQERTTQRELVASGRVGSLWGADIITSPTLTRNDVVDWQDMEVISARMSCRMVELMASRNPVELVDHFREEIRGAEDRRLLGTLLSDTDATTITSVSEEDDPVIGIEDIQRAVDQVDPANSLAVLSPSTLGQVFQDSPLETDNLFNIPIHESPYCPSDAVYILNNSMGSRQQVREPLMTWEEHPSGMRMYLNFHECWKIKIKSSDHRLIRRKRNRFEMLEMEDDDGRIVFRKEDFTRFKRLELDNPM